MLVTSLPMRDGKAPKGRTLDAVSGRYELTYEGLKRASVAFLISGPLGCEPTYEGLRPL